MNNLELKEIRKKMGLSQTEFANLFEKTSMRTIQNWVKIYDTFFSSNFKKSRCFVKLIFNNFMLVLSFKNSELLCCNRQSAYKQHL